MENRESNVADGIQNSSDSIIKNLQYGTIKENEEESKDTEIQHEIISNIVQEKTYMPKKELQGNQRVIDNILDTTEFEWQETQHNIFPPNLTGTHEIEEEIIQMEEEEETEDYQENHQPNQHHQNIMNKMIDAEPENNFQPLGDNYALSTGQEFTPELKQMYKEGNGIQESESDDNEINLRSIENPKQIDYLWNKEDVGKTDFNKVVMLSPFDKDDASEDEELLFAGNFK